MIEKRSENYSTFRLFYSSKSFRSSIRGVLFINIGENLSARRIFKNLNNFPKCIDGTHNIANTSLLWVWVSKCEIHG